MKLARIGLYQPASTTGRHTPYLVELLEQERLTFTGLSELPATGEYDLVLRAGGQDALSSDEIDYISAGGRLLAFSLEEGPEGKAKSFGQGHAAVKGQPLRFFAGRQLRGASLERGSATAAETSAPLVQEFAIGRGRLIHATIDVPDTIVRIQQGVGLLSQDRPSAPDGTAETAEGILKADDTTTLDWIEDRGKTATGQPYFPLAHADRWRQWLVEEIVGIVSPRVLLRPAAWPGGAPAVVHLSLDSDDNDSEHAETALALLDALDIRATWCELEGGYGPEMQKRVHAAGHEVALHYNARPEENGVWSEEAFVRQLARHNAAAPVPAVSNKNHYTRFEGWDEFYIWCDAGGIRLDGTRGPSKMGNRGFLYGTCFPHRPAAFDPAAPRHRVYSLAFQTADIDFEPQRWGDSSIIGPLVDEVMAVGGCLHLLNHQRWLHKFASVREALTRALSLARSRGMASMTGRQIADWTDALRAVRIAAAGNGVVAENLPSDAVLEVLSADGLRRLPPPAPDGAVQLAS
jgi:hypothetical protein